MAARRNGSSGLVIGVIWFVAFDADPGAFALRHDVGGQRLPAGDPPGLERALQEIHEGKILAEAIDAGEATGRTP